MSQLQIHLADDTYRSFQHLQRDGRNVFQTILWRLDQLAAHRGHQESPGDWEDQDAVIEFARGRALERLRRYEEAWVAYDRVARAGRLLSRQAKARLPVLEVLSAHAAVPRLARVDPDQQLAFMDAWSSQWRALANELEGTPQALLALQEAESWEEQRVQYFLSEGRLEAAISACRRLIRRHRDSKLYPQHLIRLGDLYAEAARDEYVRSRTHQHPFDAERYERYVDRAFSAYELAREARKPQLRKQAQGKIQALLAYHEGVRSDIR